MLLRDIIYDDIHITDMQCICIDKDSVQLYYALDDSKGFVFYAVEFCSVPCDVENNQPNLFDRPDVEVECLYHGIARFDGMRHLYMGHKDTGNEGYLYYADIKDHIKIFQALQVIIEAQCDLNEI